MLGGWDTKIPVMLQSTVVDALQGIYRAGEMSDVRCLINGTQRHKDT